MNRAEVDGTVQVAIPHQHITVRPGHAHAQPAQFHPQQVDRCIFGPRLPSSLGGKHRHRLRPDDAAQAGAWRQHAFFQAPLGKLEMGTERKVELDLACLTFPAFKVVSGHGLDRRVAMALPQL
ncbi:hypothetical protein D3C79_830530 [compost metagenome]